MVRQTERYSAWKIDGTERPQDISLWKDSSHVITFLSSNQLKKVFVFSPVFEILFKWLHLQAALVAVVICYWPDLLRR